MINVVYLILVFYVGNSGQTVVIPQANMKQCEINRKYYETSSSIRNNGAAYCTAGVMATK